MTDVLNYSLLAATQRRDQFSSLLALMPGLIIVVLVMGPSVWLALQSFYASGQLSLEHYQRMLENPSYASIMLNTLQLSAIVTLIVVLVGYPTTYAITLLPGRSS